MTSSKNNRDIDLLIPDIKHLRFLSKLLGKLHIYFYQRNDPPPAPYGYSDNYPEWLYGVGLAESKRYFEDKYNYKRIHNPRLFERGNLIQEIRSTRSFLSTLNVLGIVDAGNHMGLYLSKEFVTRQRRREGR